jgi:hypothetical protein
MRWYIDFVLINLPGLLTGLVVGLIIILVGYQSGWRPGRSIARAISRTRSNNKIPSTRLNASGLVVGVLSFFLLFIVVSLLVGWLARPITQAAIGRGGQPEPKTRLDDSADPNTAVKAVRARETVTFHKNAIVISVIAVTADKVTFNAGSPGYENQEISEAVNGHAFVFKADDEYDIRVTSISRDGESDNFLAEFTVTKLVDKEL